MRDEFSPSFLLDIYNEIYNMELTGNNCLLLQIIVNYDIELLGLKINLFNLKQIDVCFYSTEGYVLFIISHILHINMFLKHFEYCTFIKIIETHIKP